MNTIFVLTTWAADLEDDVENINGCNRDYLLAGWAKHTFEFSETHNLGYSFGIIDSTDYVDENAFANFNFMPFSWLTCWRPDWAKATIGSPARWPDTRGRGLCSFWLIQDVCCHHRFSIHGR